MLFKRLSDREFKKRTVVPRTKEVCMFPREYYGAIATLTGCIIGAGVLAIPYVFVQSGFWTGMLTLCILTIAITLLHLMIGEVSLRSQKCHQLPGYAQVYLGKTGKVVMLVAMAIGVYGAMLAYSIGVGESLFVLFGGSQIVWRWVFFAAMSALVFGGLQMLARSEVAMELVKFGVFGLMMIALFTSPLFSPDNFTQVQWDALLVPYGVIFFALLGMPIIPEIRAELHKCPRFTKSAILLGTLIPAFCYALFALGVVGITGAFTTEVATIGVAALLGPIAAILFHGFAIFAMATSFIALGYALKDSFCVDFKIPHVKSWLLTIGVPLLLLAIGIDSFSRTLEIAGAFAGGIAGLCIMMIHAKARKQKGRVPEFSVVSNWALYGLLGVLFIIGMLHQLFA